MNHSEFFSHIVIYEEDYKDLCPGEAYRTGMEMGCFIQAVAVSNSLEGSAVIRIPSEHGWRVERFLNDIGANYKIGWVNDDVMIVRVEK